jgi:hypothetical protein
MPVYDSPIALAEYTGSMPVYDSPVHDLSKRISRLGDPRRTGFVEVTSTHPFNMVFAKHSTDGRRLFHCG